MESKDLEQAREDAVSDLDLLAHLMTAWARDWEKYILQHGTPLDEQQLADAEGVGVKSPEGVRLLVLPNIPLPHYPLLFSTFVKSKLFDSDVNGLTVGRGVFIKAKCFVMRYWVTHELVHVAQFERFDGMEPTFRQYFSEILTEGYKDSALEKEAHEAALNWLGRDGAFRKRVPYLFQ